MVRKWSYLEMNSIKLSQSRDNSMFIDFRDKPVSGLKKRHSFKVFRNTTRFKRWTVGITKIVRKKYIRRKHLTNFMSLNYITSCWVSFYLKQRNFTRFFQGLGLINNQFTSTEHSIVLKKALTDLDKNRFGILSLSVSTNFQKHLNETDKPFLHILNNNKLLIYDCDNNPSKSAELFSNTRELDTFQTTPSVKLPTYSDSLNVVSIYGLSLCSTTYRIIYTLTLLNCFK